MTRGVGADVTVHRYGAGWDSVVNENGSGTVLGAWVMTPGARGKKPAYVTGGLQGAQGRKNFTTEDTDKGKIMARGVGADVTVHRYGAGWDSVVNENGSGAVLGAWVMTRGARGKKPTYVTGGLQGAQGEKNFTTEDTEKKKIMTRGVGTDVTVHRYGAGWDSVVNENGSGTVLGAWAGMPTRCLYPNNTRTEYEYDTRPCWLEIW